MGNETMTRERMRAIQRLPKQQIVRIHSCTCGQLVTKLDPGHTWPLVRVGTREEANRYRCSRCGRAA